MDQSKQNARIGLLTKSEVSRKLLNDNLYNLSSSSSMYFPLLPSIFTRVNKKKEEGRSGTTGTGVSQKDL